MPLKINLTIPVNSLGYGMHALGYYIALSELGYRIKVNPIGEPCLKAAECFHYGASMLKDIAADPFKDAPNFIVWHPQELPKCLMPGVPNIGAGAFELEPLTPAEQAGFNSVDIAVTYSDWGLSLIDNPNKMKIWGPALAWKVIEDKRIDILSCALSPGISSVISAGKWELRKGHPEYLATITQLAREGFSLQTVAFWNNPFTGGLVEPIKAITNLGWKLKGVTEYASLGNAKKYTFFKEHSRIELFSHIERYDSMIAQYKFAQAMVSLSKGEGWDLPVVDMLSIGTPVFMTDNTAHSEYVYKPFSIPPEEHIIKTAEDGVFFKGQGSWHVPNPAYTQQKLKAFLQGLTGYQHNKQHIFFEEHKDTITDLRTERSMRKQLEAIIGAANNVKV